MSEAQLLADRFRAPVLNGKWIANTNLQEQLKEVSLTDAIKQVSGLNSLAALTYHIDYYVAGVLPVFEGGTLDIRDKYSFDLPELYSEADWKQLKEKLWQDAEKYAQAVEKLSIDQLNAAFVHEKYGSYRRNIEGMIEHAYYHLGQVVLIRKLLNA